MAKILPQLSHMRQECCVELCCILGGTWSYNGANTLVYTLGVLRSTRANLFTNKAVRPQV